MGKNRAIKKGMKNIQMFTDEELLEEYNKGLNDGEISRRFNVHDSQIARRRYKLGLVANFRPKLKTLKDMRSTRKIIIARLNKFIDKKNIRYKSKRINEREIRINEIEEVSKKLSKEDKQVLNIDYQILVLKLDQERDSKLLDYENKHLINKSSYNE